MGYQLFCVPGPWPEDCACATEGMSSCRMRMALGSTVFEPGLVGTVLKSRPKPRPSHSLVTPVQVVGPEHHSTRIHGPVMAEAVVGFVVNSPKRGNCVPAPQPTGPLSI